MGLFDYVFVDDAQFRCSEGHDLCDEDFQSKDFGCTMGDVVIDVDGYIEQIAGEWGTPGATADEVSIYCYCTKCPAFVQFGTGNLVAAHVEFALRLDGNRVASVERTSPPTQEWIAQEPKAPYMAHCEGPMRYADALELHKDYPRLRPEQHARWAREAEERRQRRLAEREAKRSGSAR